MSYPHQPAAGEGFAEWIQPHLDELLDEAISETRAQVESGKLLSQQDQLHVIDQLIKDRKERALLIERGSRQTQ